MLIMVPLISVSSITALTILIAAASFLIAACSLILTCVVFYLVNLKKANVKIFNNRPRTYSMKYGKNSIILGVPLTFINSGAKGEILSNIKLRFVGKDEYPFKLMWLMPKIIPDSNSDLASDIIVDKYSYIKIICGFIRDGSNVFDFKKGLYHVNVDIITSKSNKWKNVGRIELYFDKIIDRYKSELWVAYDNHKGAELRSGL